MFLNCVSNYIIPVKYIYINELDISEDKLHTIDSVIIVEESCKKNSNKIAIGMANRAIKDIESASKEKINAIWLETSGCFGEVISLLDSEEPDVIYMLEKFVDMQFWGSMMGDQGETAYDKILNLSNKEFILIVSGAIPTKDNGLYTTIATNNGKRITAMELVSTLSQKAKYVVAVGTCACFGGPTAAKPNESRAFGVSELLNRQDIINIPGCPANPVWTMGILGYLTSVGVPKLDGSGRPIDYYGETIHDRCPRRSFFDAGVFSETFGGKECMFMLGCRGPVTYSNCSVSGWNYSENWPIGDNTTCIGCANPNFPDGTEPFVKYRGGRP